MVSGLHAPGAHWIDLVPRSASADSDRFTGVEIRSVEGSEIGDAWDWVESGD